MERRKSKVKDAMKKFMAGKKTGGKRTSPYSQKTGNTKPKKKATKKPPNPGVLLTGLAGAAARKMKEREKRNKQY